jgi:hypothetical protein
MKHKFNIMYEDSHCLLLCNKNVHNFISATKNLHTFIFLGYNSVTSLHFVL